MRLLLLPGMDGTGTLFGPLLQALPPTLAATVVEYPRDAPRSYDELLAGLPIPNEPFVIIAESFSGPLAVRLAAAETPHLRGIVLAASFVRSPSRLARWAAASPLLRLPPPDLVLRWALLGADASAHDLARLRAAIGSVAPHVLAHRLREISRVDVREALRCCRVPALALTASADRIIPGELTAELTSLFPSMEHVTLDAPHLVLQRRPVEAASCIAAFIERRTPLT